MKKNALAILITLTILVSSAKISAIEFVPAFIGSQKMGLSIKRQWKISMQKGVMDAKVVCTVKLKEPHNKKVLQGLENAGFRPKTMLKTVITGDIDVGNLPMLVAIDMVKSVEAEKGLSLK